MIFPQPLASRREPVHCPRVRAPCCECLPGNSSLILVDETDSQGWRSPLKNSSDFPKGDPKGDTATGLNPH